MRKRRLQLINRIDALSQVQLGGEAGLICGGLENGESKKAEVPRMLARGNAGCTNQFCINLRVVLILR
jgi:hypothetical protein